MAEPILQLLFQNQILETIKITKDVTTVGRLPDNDVAINNLGISRYHCKIVREKGDVFYVEDLESANGTRVNGVMVKKSPLYKGDEIQLGKHKLIFLLAEKGVAGFFKSEEEQAADPWVGDRTIVTTSPPVKPPRPEPASHPPPPPPPAVTPPEQPPAPAREEVSKEKYDRAVFEYVLKWSEYGIKVTFGDKIVSMHGLRQPETTIGRNKENDIVVDNLGVSRLHAKIALKDGQYFIEDQGSANGVKVNGVQVRRSPLYRGDEILIGKHVLTFNSSKRLMEGVEEGDIRRPLPSEPWHTGTYAVMPPMERPAAEAPQPDSAQPPAEEKEDTLPWEGKYAVKVMLNDREIASYALKKKVTCIGRLKENDIVIDNIGVSRLHAKIVIEDNGQCHVEDQESANGIMVNGLPLRRSPLYPGDEVVIVKHKLIFDLAHKAQPTREATGGAMSVETWRKDSTMMVSEADREKMRQKWAERAAREKAAKEPEPSAAEAPQETQTGPEADVAAQPEKKASIAAEIIPELKTAPPKPPSPPPAKADSGGVAKKKAGKFAEPTLKVEPGGLKRIVKLVASDGRVARINKNKTVLGKAQDADIKVSGKWIRKRHAIILREGAVNLKLINKGIVVKPKVNGEPVIRAMLDAGDTIELGDARLTVEFEWEE